MQGTGFNAVDQAERKHVQRTDQRSSRVITGSIRRMVTASSIRLGAFLKEKNPTLLRGIFG